MKGNPKFNARIDTDVLVAEVRETSRKPDEVYGLIDRMCPNSRKIGGLRARGSAIEGISDICFNSQKSLDECTTHGMVG
jgi:N6-adenosine-specific RNA methylase IME4